MSDDSNILNLEGKTRLSADITLLMLKGAGLAAAFLLTVWLVIAVIVGVGRALPEDSRFTPDPNLGFNMTLMPVQDVLA